MQSISKRELFIQAFDTYKLHASFLFNIGLLMFAIQIIIPSIITGLLGGGGAGYIVYQIAYTILSTGISLGIIVQMIQLVRGGEPEDVSNIFNHFHKVPSNLLGSFIIISGMICMITLFLMMTTGLEMYQEIINRAADGLEPDWEIILGENPSSIMILGIILMGISIVYLSIKTHFFVYFIMDKNTGAIESIKRSFIATNGLEAELFIVWALLGCMNLIGAMLYMIGLLFTLPFTIMVISLIYHKHLSN